METVDRAAGGEGAVLQGGAGVADAWNSKLVLQLFDCLSVQIAGGLKLESLRAAQGLEVLEQPVLEPRVHANSGEILHPLESQVDLAAHELRHLVRSYPREHSLLAAVSKERVLHPDSAVLRVFIRVRRVFKALEAVKLAA